MSPTESGPLAVCHALIQRFADVTAGHAKAELQMMPLGGVILRYLQGCPHVANQPYELIYEDRLSILRAMDSLILHVSRALAANVEGTELSSVGLEDANAAAGVVHLSFYCPAWHQAYSVPCKYVSEDIPNGKHVTLSLVAPTDLTILQSTGWDRLYDAGLVGQLHKILPLASQVVAQLIMFNDSFGLGARMVLLPGEHREYTGFSENGVVLSGFKAGPGYWNVYPKGNDLIVDTETGREVLAPNKLRELNGALARWQAVCEAVGDTVKDAES